MATKKTNSKKKAGKKKAKMQEPNFIVSEALIVGFFLLSLLLFLSNFGLIGKMGAVLRSVQMGLFGVLGYVFPVLLFLVAVFCISNKDNPKVYLKLIALFFVTVSVAGILHVFLGPEPEEVSKLTDYYRMARGGGLFGGVISAALTGLCGKIGTVLILLAVTVISGVYITERSFVSAVRTGGVRAYEKAKDDASRIHDYRQAAREQRLAELEMQKVSGIDFAATDLKKDAAGQDLSRGFSAAETIQAKETDVFSTPADGLKIPNPDVFTGRLVLPAGYEGDSVPFEGKEVLDAFNKAETILSESHTGETHCDEDIERVVTASGKVILNDTEEIHRKMQQARRETEAGQVREEANASIAAAEVKPYQIPPMNCLVKGKRSGNFSDKEYKETAVKLQQTLRTFGIAVTVTDISCGPTVTRYELQPELGVKVSRILSLQDDLKLALAAAEIRIEAPIPGKSAIGIEVPNKENNTVYLRDLLESPEYQNSGGKLAFALGKDIGGKTVVADIAKMPHLLIAGATGSGKSVCINTLIMSILYKYTPQQVKLVMVDPKVVELSVYNGIPHLLIPVVNDPKKAAGALNWAVSEMMDRYKKFEALGARDIDAYNSRVEPPEKLPLICIIIDELADLMMVARSEIEDSIVHISQLARAAGIHLVIATQRPSVNVITGLIKANIPSRIAFAVSSGVDSRTIIDTVGAEKLLGKGDMLFAPQSEPKPIRLQGAFVSDQEIAKVVNFIKKEQIAPSYTEETVEQITAPASPRGGEAERDDLFVQAGRYIIDKNKASIGNLQRAFRIGFNRAARIMDQLEEAGVVGPEQGTKPREVLMSPEQFEEML